MPDNRNFIIAIALSIAVLIGWQFFIAGPEMEKARQKLTAAIQLTPKKTMARESTRPISTAARGAQITAKTPDLAITNPDKVDVYPMNCCNHKGVSTLRLKKPQR